MQDEDWIKFVLYQPETAKGRIKCRKKREQALSGNTSCGYH